VHVAKKQLRQKPRQLKRQRPLLLLRRLRQLKLRLLNLRQQLRNLVVAMSRRQKSVSQVKLGQWRQHLRQKHQPHPQTNLLG
jgi:hypothetical protein